MKKTEDVVIDTIVRCFCEVARPIVRRGGSLGFENCLQTAVSEARLELKREHHIDSGEFKARLWAEEDTIRELCRKRVLEMEKRGNLLSIRKTSAAAILDGFRESSGLEMTYRLRDNSSAGLCFKIPSTGQYLIVNTSFSKLMSPVWLENMEADVKEFIAISERLGRMKVSWCRID